MTESLSLLDDADIFSLAVLVGALCFLGSKVVDPERSAYRWGQRLAVAAFFLYAALSLADSGPSQLLSVTFRGLIAAGLTLGTSWVVLPAVGWFYDRTVGVPLSRIRSLSRAAQQAAEGRRKRRELDEQQKRSQREYERGAPERERARLAAQAQAEAEGLDQKRRQDARAACQLLYHCYAPEIGSRFPRSAFDEFAAEHLNDSLSADMVQERARQLCDLMKAHFNTVCGEQSFKTIEQLAGWYRDQRQRIEGLPLDRDFKQTHLTQLNERYLELTERHLGSLRP
jgi:hypothetical protein